MPLPAPAAGACRLRPAVAAEAATLKAIVTETFLELYRGHDHPAPRPTTVDFAPLIEQGQVWVIEAPAGPAAAPVGALVLEEHPHYLRIDIVAILPAHQHRGYGRTAIAFAEAQAAARGLSEVRFYTNTTIERNVAFYRAQGYVESGRWQHPKRPGEIYVDFAKPVAPATVGPTGRRGRDPADGGRPETALDRDPPRAT
jgi:ribosomal protein S18 acetylase RimI-like enzyme